MSGITQVALMLAGRLDPDRGRLVWEVAVRLDGLRGAVAVEGRPAGAYPVAFERDSYTEMTRVTGAALLDAGKAAAVAERLLGGLWRDLGIADRS